MPHEYEVGPGHALRAADMMDDLEFGDLLEVIPCSLCGLPISQHRYGSGRVPICQLREDVPRVTSGVILHSEDDSHGG
jgi:hypothetical protein